MRNKLMIVGALTLLAAGCGKKNEAKPETKAEAKPEAPKVATPEPTPAKTPDPAPVAAGGAKKLYLDVHELGAGKVTAKDVAEAHKKDLATEGKYGVDYKAYWVDEKEGKIYCLAEAPSAEAASTVHKEAHGLVASKVMEVTADNGNWTPSPGMKLFMDVHHMGPGKVTADDVAGAHKKDLAVEGKHNVKYLNYWLDKDTGTIMCLSEAPNAEAALAVHKEAHGLMPESIAQVSEGR